MIFSAGKPTPNSSLLVRRHSEVETIQNSPIPGAKML